MKKISVFSLLGVLFLACGDGSTAPPVSTSGVQKAAIKVETDDKGHTTEQNNITARLMQDNKIGAVKHLYVISAYSGQVILYSTVQGKVTSSGKRLSPTTVAAGRGNDAGYWGIPVLIGNSTYYTSEVLQDDGTYGSSDPYLYWFDSKGIYHQHYLSGGQIVHVSSQPIAVKNIIINIEAANNEEK